jgi:transaldolase / glucose-6-phosphate isomerase
MKKNPLLKLESFGQSIWLDYIRRGMMDSGELQKLIREDGLHGVTSNPSIFEKAIAGSHDYDEAVRSLIFEGKNKDEIYEAVAVADIQRAADLFRPVYDRLDGKDGFVSLEVSPKAAHDTRQSIAEGRHLWSKINRPNVMIKIPGTKEGLPAIRQLISEGINVNITLLFGLARYIEVTDAFLAGMEDLAAKGKPLDRIASVASFFLSRIDVLLDPLIEEKMKSGSPQAEIAASLHGQVAIASAKAAYKDFKEIFSGERFTKLAEKGARVQRLLWASTSTKNPAYSDVMYVETLIGPDTINTLPLETIDAYRDHGDPAPRLEVDMADARRVLDQLPQIGIDLDAATQKLEDEGVQKFSDSFAKLMDVLEEKRKQAAQEPIDRQTRDLKGYEQPVREVVGRLVKEDFGSRLWRKDADLWKKESGEKESIRQGMGWLHVSEKMEENLPTLTAFAHEVWDAGFQQVVHMGMGGSSLAPMVFARTFQPGQGGLPLTILDSTDPGTILRIQSQIPLKDTLFIVASKSGTTAEPGAFERYFYEQVKAVKGSRAGENFIAITDPGTELERLAKEKSYRRVFQNFPDIGGRYSALSYFGLVPAVLMNLDVSELLVRSLRMARACDMSIPVEQNPGLVLGAVMGGLARQGRDKVTFIMPPLMSTFGMWLEQLLAESTGKKGTGLLPVAGEPLGTPSVYGEDRLFVYFQLKGWPNQDLENGVQMLRQAGHPVVTIQLDDLLDIGQEFFRWEIAVAAAGAVLGINPFNQPNVQESKDNTDRLLNEIKRTGKLPTQEPALVEGPMKFYAKDHFRTANEALQKFLEQSQPGNYVALMAYMTENAETEQTLQTMRLLIRDRLRIATTVGYGPRFLHSTGQYHKGGPNTGLFLQIVSQNQQDVPIPGESYSFGMFKQAQALGDLQSLIQHGRRVQQIELSEDINRGMTVLEEVEEHALASQ